MNIKNLMPLGVLTMLAACHKETPPPPAVKPAITSTHDYYKMNKGSYWVYQVYDVDTLNNYTLRSQPDSSYITGDTLIAGQTYHMMKGTRLGLFWPSYLRDSSSWLINEKGTRLCTFSGAITVQTAQTNSSGLFSVALAMASGIDNVTVPAGTFSCVDVEETVHNLAPNPVWQIHQYDQKYADGTGLVWETIGYYSQPSHSERRLLRYHIN
jgi:hypothetical protein